MMRPIYQLSYACLYLLAYTWLFGSLLSPFMALLLWGGTKWKQLHWLRRGSGRWLFIWGGYGLIRVISSATFRWLRWIRYITTEWGHDIGFLSWPGAVVYAALYVLHFPVDSIATTYWWIVVSLTAVVEGVMAAGVAAIVWWAFNSTTQPASAQSAKGPARKYVVAILIAACLLGIANNAHSWRPVTCCDCFWPHGIPFTFYHEGGIAGGEDFVWKGIIGDTLVILLAGTGLGWAWNRQIRKRHVPGQSPAL